MEQSTYGARRKKLFITNSTVVTRCSDQTRYESESDSRPSRSIYPATTKYETAVPPPSYGHEQDFWVRNLDSTSHFLAVLFPRISCFSLPMCDRMLKYPHLSVRDVMMVIAHSQALGDQEGPFSLGEFYAPTFPILERLGALNSAPN